MQRAALELLVLIITFPHALGMACKALQRSKSTPTTSLETVQACLYLVITLYSLLMFGHNL